MQLLGYMYHISWNMLMSLGGFVGAVEIKVCLGEDLRPYKGHDDEA